MFCCMFFVFSKNNFAQLFFFINLIVVFHFTVNCYCFCTTESHICMIALTSGFFFLTYHIWVVKKFWKQVNNSDPAFCNCGLQKCSTDNKCIICSNSLWAKIEASIKEGKNLISWCCCPTVMFLICESGRVSRHCRWLA